MVESKEMPLTVYGLLARRHSTTESYVGEVVRGTRKAKWGKGQSILRDFKLLQSSLDDWYCHTLNDRSMRFEMTERVTVYVQNGIASVFRGSDLLKEIDVSKMTVNEFRCLLNDIRLEFN